MNLNDVNHKMRAKPERRRVGRGQGSGWGHSSGRGNKGARARSGWRYKLFREGGQMPIARRLPKRGFNNALFSTTWAFVNLRDLNAFKDGETVSLETCVERGLIPRVLDGLKVLGHGELERKLTIKAHRISKTARAAVEAKGGKVELIAVSKDDARKRWKAQRGKGKSATRRKEAKAAAVARKAAQAKK